MYVHILAAVAVGANMVLHKRIRELKQENEGLKQAHELHPAADITPGSDTDKPTLYKRDDAEAEAERQLKKINAEFWENTMDNSCSPKSPMVPDDYKWVDNPVKLFRPNMSHVAPTLYPV